MNELESKQTSENLLNQDALLSLTEEILKAGLDPDKPTEGFGHVEMRVDGEIWVSAIKGETNANHIVEVKLFSINPADELERTLAMIDLLERTVTDAEGNPLNQEQMAEVNDYLIQLSD